jgi:DNA-binding NtrC family response regulator
MSSNKVILLVDDELIILESLKIQFQNFIADDRIMIEVASSGEEAKELLHDFKNDNFDLRLIISDYNLEDMMGTDLLSEAQLLYPNAIGAILTGQPDFKFSEESNLGPRFKNMIDKPWSYEELSVMISKALSV